jgi:D-3-phosphoglycerate dehydrogenase
MLETADILTLHCPLTPQTEGLIDKGALARMKRTALLVNTARGGVVVERDLIEALRDGVIAGAAMDVFAQEPLPADSPLIGLDNLLMTPHLASANAENFEPTVRRMFANIARVARGEEPAAGDVVA